MNQLQSEGSSNAHNSAILGDDEGRRGLKMFGFRGPRAGRRGSKKGSESMPFIHEKWRKSEVCILAPGNGDLERAKVDDDKIKLRLRRLRLGIRWLQMICSYVPLSKPKVNFVKVIDCCAYWTKFGDVSSYEG